MFEAALWVIAAAVLVVAFSPLDLTFAVERGEDFHATIGFRWMFLGWSTELRRREGQKRRKQKEKKRVGVGVRRAVRVFRMMPDKLGTVRAFFRRLGRAIRWRALSGELRFGTGDPADTGRLWGIVASLLAWINRPPALDIAVTPDFVEAGVTGAAAGSVRVYPSLVVWALVRLLVSRAAIRFGVAVLRSRRAGR